MKFISRVALSVMVAGGLALPVWSQDAATAGGSGQAAGAGAGQASDSSAGKGAGRADRAFVEKAAAGGLMEVQLGKMAQEKASDQQVKDFGKRMEDDHSKANDQLKSVAQSVGVTPPTSLPAKEQAQVDKLSKLSGADFDKQYMTMMVSDHKKDVAEFQKASKGAKDEGVKSFASSTLPTLQEHLKLAEEIHGKVGGKAAAAKQPEAKQ